jgi:hypothetical protein
MRGDKVLTDPGKNPTKQSSPRAGLRREENLYQRGGTVPSPKHSRFPKIVGTFQLLYDLSSIQL